MKYLKNTGKKRGVGVGGESMGRESMQLFQLLCISAGRLVTKKTPKHFTFALLCDVSLQND